MPLSACQCVDLIITDIAVIEVKPDGLLLKEFAPGWTVEEIKALTNVHLNLAANLKEMEL
jgi:acyl CoA:acetate/3-ketoacid CoA transferase beta subunit